MPSIKFLFNVNSIVITSPARLLPKDINLNFIIVDVGDDDASSRVVESVEERTDNCNGVLALMLAVFKNSAIDAACILLNIFFI